MTAKIVEAGKCAIDGEFHLPCFYEPKRSYWNGWATPLIEEQIYKDFLSAIDDGSEESARMREYTQLEGSTINVLCPETGRVLRCFENVEGFCWDEVK